MAHRWHTPAPPRPQTNKRRGRIAPKRPDPALQRAHPPGRCFGGRLLDTDGVAWSTAWRRRRRLRSHIEPVTERSPASSLDNCSPHCLEQFSLIISVQPALVCIVTAFCAWRLTPSNDVDFAIVGPRGGPSSKRNAGQTPQCATGHVLQVEDYEPMCILGVAGEADGRCRGHGPEAMAEESERMVTMPVSTLVRFAVCASR